MEESVILVDTAGQMIGTMDKLEAHRCGKLHSAFSIFVFNTQGQLLLQKRASGKYHSGGKWTNTCCSHPKLGETVLESAHRRLAEEMGMECELNYAFNFTYQAELENGLIEHEYDDVFFGISDDLPLPSPAEVEDFRYITIEELDVQLTENADQYTEWLKICFSLVLENYHQIF